MHDWVYNTFRGGKFFCFLAICLIGIFKILSPDAEHWGTYVARLHQQAIIKGDYIQVSLAALYGIFEWLARYVGSPPAWRCVEKILQSFQRETFSELNGDQTNEHHRVTLYKHKQTCFCPWLLGRCVSPRGKRHAPWSGWLVPVARGGPSGKGSTIFLAKRGTEKKNEGVAGKAFFSQTGFIDLENLGNVTTRNERTITTYCETANVEVEFVKGRLDNGSVCARCFRALRIEVNGKDWGVLMIDSSATQLPGDPNEVSLRFQQIAADLNILLWELGI